MCLLGGLQIRLFSGHLTGKNFPVRHNVVKRKPVKTE